MGISYRIVIKEKKKPYWILQNWSNGRTLSTSQPYASRSNARRAAKRVSWDLDITLADETQRGRR